MGIIVDEIKRFRHPEIEKGIELLYKDCRTELERFCMLWGIPFYNLSFDDKERIFYHRISIKLDSIRYIYKEVQDARTRYPDGFDLLFEQLFSKRMPTSKDCTFGKRDAEDSVYRDAFGRIQADTYAGISLNYFTYSKAFVRDYYTYIYESEDFGKYVFDSTPSLSQFKNYLERVFRPREIPTEVNHLSIDHIRLLYSNLRKLPDLQEIAIRKKRIYDEIECNPLRQQYKDQYLGANDRLFSDTEYLIDNLPGLDLYISNKLREQVDTIKRYYPDGYSYYCRHNNPHDLSSIIAAVDKIKAYNQYGERVAVYDLWEKRQKSLTSDIKHALSRSNLKIHSESSYSPGYERLMVNGQIGKLDYQISQVSLYPFCANTNLDYSLIPEIGNLSRRCSQAINGANENIFGASIINSIDATIKVLTSAKKNDLLVVIPTCGDDEKDRVIYREFCPLCSSLKDKGISILNLSAESSSDSYLVSNDFTSFKRVFVIDLFQNTQSLKRILSFFNEIDDYRPAIFYCSLLHPISENEVRIKIKDRQEEIAKEQRQKAIEEQRRKEEAIRLEKVRQERLEREKIERAERAERDRLYALSHNRKSNYKEFLSYLSNNGVKHLYHMTDRRNLESIKQRGGLYSWDYCESHGIQIAKPGGDGLSRNLDRRHGLEDFVRLSFARELPMFYHREHDDLYEPVLLYIKPDVAGLYETLFSDMNATDNMHHHGGKLSDLMAIDLNATRRKFVRRDDPDFQKKQAEVMVKTFIPLEYIENINDFI